MKNKKAIPLKVHGIMAHFDIENGVIGYKFEVLFQGKNIPKPFYGRVWHSTYYEHFDQTDAMYLFPFIGYGLINIAKISVDRFHKKLEMQQDKQR